MTEQTPKFCLWEEILESYRKRGKSWQRVGGPRRKAISRSDAFLQTPFEVYILDIKYVSYSINSMKTHVLSIRAAH